MTSADASGNGVACASLAQEPTILVACTRGNVRIYGIKLPYWKLQLKTTLQVRWRDRVLPPSLPAAGSLPIFPDEQAAPHLPLFVSRLSALAPRAQRLSVSHCSFGPVPQLGVGSNALRVLPVLERMTREGGHHSVIPTKHIITGDQEGAVLFHDPAQPPGSKPVGALQMGAHAVIDIDITVEGEMILGAMMDTVQLYRRYAQ